MYQLQKVATYLAAHPERTVTIEGFSDDSGNRFVDRRLSEDRALAAQSALISLGVDSRRIAVRGYGDARPLASNDTAAGRQINRRVEILIL
jgi:outer membrane protein OmpA-like peptidoglycan-associated protein